MSDWDNIIKFLSKDSYNSWGKHLSFKGIKNGIAEFCVPTEFFRDWIRRSFKQEIIGLFAKNGINVSKIDIKVESAFSRQDSGIVTAEHFPVSETISAKQETLTNVQDSVTSPLYINEEKNTASQTERNFDLTKTDSRYNFDNFIVGDSNEFAYALAKRVASEKSEGCNPLFFYSSVGLGKTHLMQAIANKVKENGNKNIIYMGADKYLRLFVKAVSGRDAKKSIEFKEIFRTVDILMIDDVQFLVNKEKTEQELLSTIDELIDAGKQVVLSASKAPSAIVGLDERLKNRMSAGIVADIMPANRELRLKILEAKASTLKCKIPHEVLEFLAENIPTNIRELEGALHRIVARAEIMGETPSMSRAADVLKDLLVTNEEHIVSINEIKTKVASFFKIKQSDLLSQSREKGIAVPRQIAMYMAKTLTTKSYPEIAKEFNRDHTTVLHGVRKIETLIKSDRNIYEQINMIRGALS